MQHATRLLEDLQEAGTIVGVTAETIIDQGACVPQRAQGACRHPLQRGMLLHDEKSLQDDPGLSRKNPFVDDIQQVVRILEVFIDGLRRLVGQRRDGGADVQQQDRVDLRDFLGRAVILLH